MSIDVKNAIHSALNTQTPVKNFITRDEATQIAAAAKADGKVTADEIKAVTDLKLEPSFYNDDAFGQTQPFPKVTNSAGAYFEVSKFLNENSLQHAFEEATGYNGIGNSRNFVTTSEAQLLVGAAKADGKIDASERTQLESIGWSFHADSAENNFDLKFERPTASASAGLVIEAALAEK